MLMVRSDPAGVESDLVSGVLVCPVCEGGVGPWGWARRRLIRGRGWVRPRRGRCRSCGVSHVLLPAGLLLRRRDHADTIGAALLAWAAGSGARRIAGVAGVPADTVRGWLRRFARRAEEIRRLFWVLAHRLDPSLGPIAPQGSGVGDALEAIGLAASAAARRFGSPASVWTFVAGATNGRLLCNTSSLYRTGL